MHGLPLGTIAALFVAAGIAWLLLSGRSGGSREPERYVGKRMLTAHEAAFLPKLEEAARRMGGYRVFAQVSMAAIVDVSSAVDGADLRGVRNTFDRKIVDFVLIDSSMRVVAIVELDDRTHDAARDRARDTITSEAGFETVRFRNGRRISVREIMDGLRSEAGRRS